MKYDIDQRKLYEIFPERDDLSYFNDARIVEKGFKNSSFSFSFITIYSGKCIIRNWRDRKIEIQEIHVIRHSIRT